MLHRLPSTWRRQGEVAVKGRPTATCEPPPCRAAIARPMAMATTTAAAASAGRPGRRHRPMGPAAGAGLGETARRSGGVGLARGPAWPGARPVGCRAGGVAARSGGAAVAALAGGAGVALAGGAGVALAVAAWAAGMGPGAGACSPSGWAASISLTLED